MSQNRVDISVRHPTGESRSISRVIQTREINGETAEVVSYNGRTHRVFRRGRGVFIWSNRPLKSESVGSLVAA